MIRQARKGIQESIKLNESKVVIESPSAMIDNGYGILVADLTSNKTYRNISCRISYEKKMVDGIQSVESVGYSTNLSKFILTDYKTPIYKGERFNNFEIMQVYPLYFMGKIIGYQAPLKEAKD